LQNSLFFFLLKEENVFFVCCKVAYIAIRHFSLGTGALIDTYFIQLCIYTDLLEEFKRTNFAFDLLLSLESVCSPFKFPFFFYRKKEQRFREIISFSRATRTSSAWEHGHWFVVPGSSQNWGASAGGPSLPIHSSFEVPRGLTTQ